MKKLCALVAAALLVLGLTIPASAITDPDPDPYIPRVVTISYYTQDGGPVTVSEEQLSKMNLVQFQDVMKLVAGTPPLMVDKLTKLGIPNAVATSKVNNWAKSVSGELDLLVLRLVNVVSYSESSGQSSDWEAMADKLKNAIKKNAESINRVATIKKAQDAIASWVPSQSKSQFIGRLLL